jgi:hypothetical protein
MLYQFTVFLQLLLYPSFHVTVFYVFEFWISKNGNFKRHFKTLNDFSRKSKVVELIKIYNFYFGHSSFDKVVVTLFIKFTYRSYSSINYKRGYVKFMNNVTTTMLDDQMTKWSK